MSEFLSILISGNKESNGGFQPLVLVGNPLFENADYSYRTGFEGSKCYFEIKNSENYIQYTFFANPSIIASYGASRNGSLCIGLSVPRGYHVVGNVSPYKILNEIKDTFFRLNMTSSGTKYNFRKEPDSPEPFENILAKDEYKLEKYEGSYVEMKGATDACVITGCENKIEQLFTDTQYPEFALYNNIVVAEAGTPTLTTLNIDIPRTHSYRIYVNGNLKDKIIKSEDERVTVTDNSLNSGYKDVESLNFCLAEVRAGKYQSAITIDDVNEVVRCTITSKNKLLKRTICFKFNTGEDFETIDREKEFFQLCCKNKNRSKCIPSNGEVIFEGEEISYSWTCKYNGEKDYKIEKDSSENTPATDTFIVNKKPLVVKPPVSLPNPGDDDGNSNKPFGINLVLKPNMSNFDSELSFCIKSIDGNVFRDYIALDVNSKNENKCFAFVPLSKYLKSCRIDEIVFSSENYKYDICYLNRRFCDGEIIPVKVLSKKTVSSKFLNILAKKFSLVIISLLIGVGLGVVLSITLKDYLQKVDKGENVTEAYKAEVVVGSVCEKKDSSAVIQDSTKIESQRVPPVTINTVQAACDNYFTELKKADLAFTEVDNINAWVEKHKNDTTKPVNYNKVATMIPLFVEAINIIGNAGTYECVASYIKVISNLNIKAIGADLKKLREAIQSTFLNSEGKMYSQAQMESILFETNWEGITSFKELRAVKPNIVRK